MGATPEEIRIVTDAMLAEAAKWARLSTEVNLLKRGAAELGLAPSAFFIGNPATGALAATAYRELHDLMVQLLQEATGEFEEISEALERAVAGYEDTDGKAAVDLRAIYGR